jgi:hypothetical protein
MLAFTLFDAFFGKIGVSFRLLVTVGIFESPADFRFCLCEWKRSGTK